MSFKNQLSDYRNRINSQLASSLPTYFQRYETQTPWTQSLEWYVTQWGKRIRPILAMMYAKELGLDIPTLGNLFCSLEVFHDFILAHDDIVDEDAIRRWDPTIHTRLETAYPHLTIHDRQHFWQALAMIGWDVLHAMAQSYIFDAAISDSTKIVLLRTMNEAMLDVAWGRYKQFLSDSMKIADVSLDYIVEYNLRQVTGSYSFLFPLRFGYALARETMEIDPLMKDLCRYVGILFQTGDDMIWLFGDPAVTGKSNDGDIIQGKKTIPLYFAYQYANLEQKSELECLVGKQDITQQEAEIVKFIVREHGLWPTEMFLQEYAGKSLQVIEKLSYSQEYKQWWRELVEYLLTRNN